jgi:hypothetical protein
MNWLLIFLSHLEHWLNIKFSSSIEKKSLSVMWVTHKRFELLCWVLGVKLKTFSFALSSTTSLLLFEIHNWTILSSFTRVKVSVSGVRKVSKRNEKLEAFALVWNFFFWKLCCGKSFPFFLVQSGKLSYTCWNWKK